MKIERGSRPDELDGGEEEREEKASRWRNFRVGAKQLKIGRQ